MTVQSFKPGPFGHNPQSAKNIGFLHPASKQASTFSQRRAGFFEWLFGPSDDEPAPALREGHYGTSGQNIEPVIKPALKVTPPTLGADWLQGFYAAISEGTTLFANRYVRIVNEDDPCTVYRVRELKIAFKGAPTQFCNDVLSLPNDSHNRVIKNRMQKAPGAQYLLLDGFYGVTIQPDTALIEGRVVQTLVSYESSPFLLEIAFLGDYVTLDAPMHPTAPAAPLMAVEVETPARPEAPMKIEKSAHTDPDPSGDGTPLRVQFAGQEPEAGDQTPLNVGGQAADKPVANLRLRSLEAEATLPLFANNFPYTVGRHNSRKGYSVQGLRDSAAVQMLHASEPAHHTSFVSRGHLVLDGYDPIAKQFRVVTTQGKNGSFFRGATLPQFTLLPLAEMAKGNWLKLGGTQGDGILEVKIETA